MFLSDGRKYKAKKLYGDESLDLSIIKIDASNLVSARFGDSDQVVVGDLAVAIGNPLGLTLQRTVTAGIISALNRSVVVRDHRGEVIMQDLIQTDASINPGNSGGPLVNSKGKIIGINTVKASKAEAIGFSIPVNMAKPVDSMAKLRQVLYSLTPGNEVEVELQRVGKIFTRKLVPASI